MMKMRIPRFQECLKGLGLDLAVFISYEFDPQMFYLTGYRGIGHLVVPSKKDPFLMVPKMEEVKASRTGLAVIPLLPKPIDGLKGELEKRDIQHSRLGVDANRITMAASNSLSSISSDLLNVADGMDRLREVKDSSEIEILQEGCRLTDKIIEKALANWSEFKTEAQVAAFLNFEAAKIGCRPSFPTIVASGWHAGIPHHETADHPLMKGFCVIDFGIVYQGYCTDTSRTVCIGAPTNAMIDAYEAVSRSQVAAIEAIRSGVQCNVLDRIARDSLGVQERLFIHGLGHGIGVEVHESPWVNARSTTALLPGMVIAIEPGVYSDAMGVRIEDDILVTQNGFEGLTKSNKGLIIV